MVDAAAMLLKPDAVICTAGKILALGSREVLAAPRRRSWRQGRLREARYRQRIKRPSHRGVVKELPVRYLFDVAFLTCLEGSERSLLKM